MADPYAGLGTPPQGSNSPTPQSMTPEQYFAQVKSMYPNAVFTGGGRDPAHNAQVGGVPDSMHLTNQAMDFQVPGVPAQQVFQHLSSTGLPMTEQLSEGQVGSQGAHLHVGWAPKSQARDPYAGLGTPPGQAAQDPYAGLGTAPSQVTQSNGPDKVAPGGIAGLISGQPQSSFDNMGTGLSSAFQSAGLHGFAGQLARYAHEGIDDLTHGGAYAQAEELSPGKSDQFYKDQTHMAYNSAVNTARNTADQQVQNNPYPGHTVGNFAAGVAGAIDPSYFVPLEGVGAGIAGRIANPLLREAAKVGISGASHAVLNSADDAAYQTADILSGVQKDYDVKQNLTAAAFGGALGAGHAVISPFVANMFKNRGIDTLPAENPQGRTTPLTGGTPPPEVAGPIQEAWKTGNEQDIFNSYHGTNITPPSHAEIHEYVKSRDNSAPIASYDDLDVHSNEPPAPPPIGQQDQRAAVQSHIDALTQNWKNAPDFEVINHIGDIQDPNMVAHALDQHADAPGTMGFVGPDNKVRIFANEVRSPEDLHALVYHEALGHYGLQQVFGSNLDATLKTLADRNVGQFGKAVDAWQKANPDAYGGSRVRAADEVMAEMSQNGPLKPVLADAVTSTLRRFGRKMGMNLAYSDAEVRNILGMAHDAVINGKSVRDNGFKMNRGYRPTDLSANAAGPNKNMFTSQRGEISDHNAQMIEPRGKTLGTTLDHPALFERYPQLRDTPVSHSDLLNDHGLVGGYDPETRTIHLDHSAGLSDTIHETQHAVQHIEGRLTEGESNQHLTDEQYKVDPREVEARLTEDRLHMTDKERASSPAKNALGEDLPPASRLDEMDRLKADPRFWTDPEYRQNVIEYARTAFPAEMGTKEKTVPLRSFAEYTAEKAAATERSLQFMNRSQLAASSDHISDDLDRVYKSLEENYVPTTQSHAEVSREALSLGFKPSQIRELGGTDGLAVKLHRMQAAANMADIKLSELSERIGTAEERPTDKSQYLSTLADFNYLNARVKGSKADIARALNVSKMARSYTNASMAEVAERMRAEGSGLADLADDPLKFMTFMQGIQKLIKGGNPAAAHIKMAGVNKPYWEQYLSTFHFNAMLSALSTHVKAPLDMMTGISHNVIDHALAYPVGKLYNAVEMMTGQPVRSGVGTGEVAGRIWGALRSVFSHEVYVKTLHAAATGEGSVVLPNGQHMLTNPASAYGGSTSARLKGGPWNVLELLNKPTDAIVAQDTFFRSHAIAQELYGLGNRQAEIDLKAAKKPYSFDDVTTLGSSYAHNPTAAMLEQARTAAEKSLLLNPNRLAGWLDKARSYRPNMTVPERLGAFAAQNLAPFIRVSSNSLLTRTIERSPLPLLNPGTWKTLAQGGPEAHIALSRMAYGTIKLGLLWQASAVGKDFLTGSGPTDPNKRKEFQAGGRVPDAVHENGRYNTGGTLNMSLNPFDLHNSTAQMVKDMRTAYEEGANKGQVGVGLTLALGAVLHDFESNSWLHDVTPGFDAADAHGQTAGQVLSQFAGDEAKTFVPGILNQLNRVGLDTNQRDTRPDAGLSVPEQVGSQIVNSVKSAIPGLSQTLPIRYSVYGDPMPTGASLTGVHTAIPGVMGNGQTETTDPTKMELERLARLSPAAVVTPVTRVTGLKNPDGTPTKMTTAQFEQYQQLAGVNIVDQTRQLMAGPQWADTPDKTKIAAVKEIEKQVKKAAREQIFGTQ